MLMIIEILLDTLPYTDKISDATKTKNKTNAKTNYIPTTFICNL